MDPNTIRKTLEDTAEMRKQAVELQAKADEQLRKALRVVNDSKVISMSEAAKKAGISRQAAYEKLKDVVILDGFANTPN
jgi:DNA-binding phage protein